MNAVIPTKKQIKEMLMKLQHLIGNKDLTEEEKNKKLMVITK